MNKLLTLFFVCLSSFAIKADDSKNTNVATSLTNSDLIAAFTEYKSKDLLSEIRLARELNKAIFIVPYTPEENFKTSEADNDIITIDKGSRFSFFLRKTKSGHVLSIATDWDGINKFLPKGSEIRGWVMPADEVWDWVLSQNSYVGVEILTSEKAYTLSSKYLSTVYVAAE